MRFFAALLFALALLPVAHAQQAPAVLLPTLSQHASNEQIQQASSGDHRIGLVIHTDDVAALERAGVDIQARFDGFVTARVAPSDVARIAAVEGVRSLEDPIEYSHNDVAAGLTGVQALRSGLVGGQAYTGAGVLVCIIDTGIDWEHLDFRNATDPTQTRIVSIWDQMLTAQAGESAPTAYGYSYGVEYTEAAIEAALGGGTALRTADTDGHGTHVAGTAAGNGASLTPAQHIGMAPDAELVVVKAGNGYYASNNILNGIDYCDQVATAQGKPVVINMSLGSDSGPHDGTDAKSQAIDAFAAKAGRVVVQSAGNSGGSAIHTTGTVAGGSTGSVTLTVPTYTASASTDNFTLDLWFDNGTSVDVTVTSPNGQTVTQTAGGSSTTNTTDGRVYAFNYIDPGNFDRHLYVDIGDQSGTEPAAGTWTIQLSNTSGTADTYHAWLADASVTGATVALGGGDSQYLVNNAAANGITVGSYVHRWRWQAASGNGYNYVGTERSNDLSSFSSGGPSRTGATLPHLTAPGQALASSLSQDATVSPVYVLAGGTHYVTQGTSMSSPVVAGIAALLLEYDATLTGIEVKQALVNAADADDYTGTVPNHSFGAGKVNAYAALARLVSGTTAPGFQAIGYDEALSGAQSLQNGQHLAVQFQQTLGHDGRMRGVLLHPSSVLSSAGWACVSVYSDNGSGNPGTPIGSCMAFPLAGVTPNTWNYADLSDAAIDLVSGVLYHLVVTMDGTSSSTQLMHDGAAASGRRSLLNTGSGWVKQSFDWAVRPVVSSGSAVLPVELAVFDGAVEAQRAVLTWLTASETNNAGFHIDAQRAGGAWEAVGFVAGRGTTAEATRYRFETDDLLPGRYRFKLRQVDFDGTVTESGVVELTVEAPHALALHLAGPNPSRGEVEVVFTVPRTDAAAVELYDLLGRRVATLFEGTAEAGQALRARTPGTELPAGLYLVRLVHGGALQTQRVVVAR